MCSRQNLAIASGDFSVLKISFDDFFGDWRVASVFLGFFVSAKKGSTKASSFTSEDFYFVQVVKFPPAPFCPVVFHISGVPLAFEAVFFFG